MATLRWWTSEKIRFLVDFFPLYNAILPWLNRHGIRRKSGKCQALSLSVYGTFLRANGERCGTTMEIASVEYIHHKPVCKLSRTNLMYTLFISFIVSCSQVLCSICSPPDARDQIEANLKQALQRNRTAKTTRREKPPRLPRLSLDKMPPFSGPPRAPQQ